MASPAAVNACAFCKKAKRKCDKARPSCSNCLRLHKPCWYIEDTIQSNFSGSARRIEVKSEWKNHDLQGVMLGVGASDLTSLDRSATDFAMRIIGSLDNLAAVSTEFFTGTHQRIPTICRLKFQAQVDSMATAPRADFAALCLSILLIQQFPASRSADMQSPLYVSVKNVINVLEATRPPSLDLLQSRVLVSFYEVGHGIHNAAYISVAACARVARMLGLHRKLWRNLSSSEDKLGLEEQKRTWWAILIMERFIALSQGDAIMMLNDPDLKDPLPIEDLFWSESSSQAAIESLILVPPTLDTPINVTVGQMARESQIAHLAGHVVRYVFDAYVPDPVVRTIEAKQLEATLESFIPLLADEELRIGKYCGGFGICNSSLFTLYEYLLRQGVDESERQRILQAMDSVSERAFKFGYAAYLEREENYPFEIHSPYLPYSLCQAATIQHRLWLHSGNEMHKARTNLLGNILQQFTQRWHLAWQYLDILDQTTETYPPSIVLFQRTDPPAS